MRHPIQGLIASFMIINAKGLACPMPLLRAKQALRKSAPGTSVTVMTTDQHATRDFTVFAEHAGLHLVCEQHQDYISLTLCEHPK